MNAATSNLQPEPHTEAVATEELTFTYRDADRPALCRLSFVQRRGEMVGVMGASGAGKSTLAKCLNRIVPAFEDGDFLGEVRIRGRSIAGRRVSEMAAEVGMVFQDFEAQLFSTNVAHEVAFAMEQAGMDRDEIASRLYSALDAVGLRGFEHRDPLSLSGGQKQRLAIASVLALRPHVMVLDEPTSDLDPQGREEVFALVRRLREYGLSLIVIEHEAVELRQCDRILLLHEGSVIAHGPPEAVMTQLDLLEQYGVHPPGLNRVLAMLGIGGHAQSIDDAEAQIRRRFPAAPPRVIHGGAAGIANPPAASADDGPRLLRVENACFAYPDGPPVLTDANLEMRPGEFLAIIGQNGSGKTTLAKLIVGLLRPGRGRVLLKGDDRTGLHPAQMAREVGYVFQNPDHQIFAATVEHEVRFGPLNFGLAEDEIARRCEEVLRAVGLENERDTDPFLLSKGQRQRLAVASVLALRPQLLILDEPTTGLDYREQRRMMRLVGELNQAGVAILMITHTPWLVAEYARRVVLMREGRIAFDGPVREFFAREQLAHASSFRPPEVTELSRRFGTVALSPAEFVNWFKGRVG